MTDAETDSYPETTERFVGRESHGLRIDTVYQTDDEYHLVVLSTNSDRKPVRHYTVHNGPRKWYCSTVNTPEIVADVVADLNEGVQSTLGETEQ